ncbi:MAG: phosphoheptose isomerase, partial [Acidimicrobiia bacterium]|nr:phosphoheptose isomerase [Acidimicrobiia bacterium]
MPDEAAFALGDLSDAVSARLAEWETHGLARRIWAKDPTVWAETNLPELTDRLGWLSLPADMAGAVSELESFADEVRTDFQHVVLLGMGGSSLAPEMYQATFGNAPGYPELTVLDSTHPGAVQDVDEQIDLEKTLFVVASKSGSTLETLSFFRYYWDRLIQAGLPQGSHFVAITDPGSSLQDLAAERGFRRVFTAPPEVGGRYSALTYFGLVPAALIGVDIGTLLASAAAAATACKNAGADNPGLTMGAAWGEAAQAGRNKLTLVVSPSLESFPAWLEQLVAESTGKDGTGIVPVADEDLAGPDAYGTDRVFLSYHLAGDPDQTARLDALAAAGHPVIAVELGTREELGSAMFVAEMATAAAGSILGIHPFNQPDVQVAKELARQAMAGELSGGAPIEEAGPRDAARISQWLASKPEGAYLGLAAFVPMTDRTTGLLQSLRHHLRDLTGAATTVGFGPRFLHSTGQLHKGGPAAALFLQIVDEPAVEMPVPETDYSFAKLVAGQAEGDYRALQDRGRTVLRVRLGQDAAAGLETLVDTVSSLA